MDKKKTRMVVNTVIVLVIVIANLLVWRYYSNSRNGNSVYMKLSDDSSTLERYFDFHKGKAYRYSTIVTNDCDIDTDDGKKSFESARKACERNDKYHGCLSKVWVENGKMVIYEVFDLNMLSDEEKKALGVDGYENKTRAQIVNSVDVIQGEDGGKDKLIIE